jgi:DNA integrity scanning protein DisA with diadenylate cyclase activity
MSNITVYVSINGSFVVRDHQEIIAEVEQALEGMAYRTKDS